MIDWASIELERTWPLWLLIATGVGLAGVWIVGRSNSFPSLALIGQRRGRFFERLQLATGATLLLLFAVLMAEPSMVIEKRLMRDARDYLLLVDTSRSMRHDTEVERASVDMHFERRANAFLETVEQPDSLPFVGRFELARESLYRFLATRRTDDRVGLLYFNDNVHPVSGLSKNVAFVTEQLGGMDEFVNYGTDIGKAMQTSLDLLERYPGNNRRTLILITDAEARFSDDLEAQFERLKAANLAFYLLWITADMTDLFSDDATAFLRLAETTGQVFKVRNPDATNLLQALQLISQTESYAYEEKNRIALPLAEPLAWPTIVIFLLWSGLAVTVWFPRGNSVFDREVAQ